MFCQKCGSQMEILPNLYFHSGRRWHGCKNCNTVIKKNFCSVSGRDLGTNPCRLSYQEFMERVAKRK